MADEELDQMLRDRDLDVIARTERKYGTLGEALAMNIVDNGEEASKILVKGLQKMWNDDVPPEGANFSVNFLRKIRDCSIFCRKSRTDLPEIEQLSELEECVIPPFYEDRYSTVEDLSSMITEFLSVLDEESRAIFVQRYFLCVNFSRLCQINHYELNYAKKIVTELVASLKKYLEKAGASCTSMSLFEAIGGIDDSSVLLGTAYQAPERKAYSKKVTIISAVVCAIIAVLLIAGPSIKSAISGEQRDSDYNKTHTSYNLVSDINKKYSTDFIGYDYSDDNDLRVTTQDIVVTYPEGCADDVEQWTEFTYSIKGKSSFASKYKLTCDAAPGDSAEDQAELDGNMICVPIDDITVWYHEYTSTQGTNNCYSADVYFYHDGWTYNLALVTSIDDRSEGYQEGYIETLLQAMFES